MATIKSYTDLNQSRKLTEILPIESADGTWERVSICGAKIDIPEDIQYRHKEIPFFIYSGIGIPSWSLAALFDALPTTIGNFFKKNALRLRMDKGENDFNIWYEYFDCWDVAKGLDVKEGNPIDACVEIIIKLYEQNFL